MRSVNLGRNQTILDWRTCQCGRPYAANNRRTGCSTICEHLTRIKARRAAEDRARQRAGYSQYGTPTATVCVQCSQPFTYDRLTRPRIYCSEQCRRSSPTYKNGRREAKRRRHWRQRCHATVETFNSRSILERDGWTCGICHEPIDRDADPLNDWAATIDHIVPLAKGGEHTPGNVRAAHRYCNAVRGADTEFAW